MEPVKSRANPGETLRLELPKAPPLKQILGPSFIILGLGLGSGEIILWPFLSSNYGLGIIWGAVIGITLQFFMNMEIERYALVHGESVFAGFSKKLKSLTWWFVLSTFIPWVWPGIAATSSAILSNLLGIQNSALFSVGLLLLIGLILSLGPTLYKTVENFQKILISIGIPIILVLTFLVSTKSGWVSLSKGIIGTGDGYTFLPAGISIASFLGALAYAGAGGNLNLAQSQYIREKGYGMGKFSGKIRSLLTGKGKQENVSLYGSTFECTAENVSEFKKWWKIINLEHLVIFWFAGLITILMLALLSYTTTYSPGALQQASNINFLFKEAESLSISLAPLAGFAFLAITSLMLFGTQLTVLDATSRIISENVVLSLSPKLSEKNLPKIYYLILWGQVLTGALILLLGFSQPLQLVTISAVLNAFTMFVHVGLTLWLNLTELERPLKPTVFRILAMAIAFIFYGGFSAYTIISIF
jgi:hypothetical protein